MKFTQKSQGGGRKKEFTKKRTQKIYFTDKSAKKELFQKRNFTQKSDSKKQLKNVKSLKKLLKKEIKRRYLIFFTI